MIAQTLLGCRGAPVQLVPNVEKGDVDHNWEVSRTQKPSPIPSSTFAHVMVAAVLKQRHEKTAALTRYRLAHIYDENSPYLNAQIISLWREKGSTQSGLKHLEALSQRRALLAPERFWRSILEAQPPTVDVSGLSYEQAFDDWLKALWRGKKSSEFARAFDREALRPPSVLLRDWEGFLNASPQGRALREPTSNLRAVCSMGQDAGLRGEPGDALGTPKEWLVERSLQKARRLAQKMTLSERRAWLLEQKTILGLGRQAWELDAMSILIESERSFADRLLALQNIVKENNRPVLLLSLANLAYLANDLELAYEFALGSYVRNEKEALAHALISELRGRMAYPQGMRCSAVHWMFRAHQLWEGGKTRAGRRAWRLALIFGAKTDYPHIFRKYCRNFSACR